MNKNFINAETASQNIFEIEGSTSISGRGTERGIGKKLRNPAKWAKRFAFIEGLAPEERIGDGIETRGSTAADVWISNGIDRSRESFLRAWLRQYALALALAAGLHAGLLLSPVAHDGAGEGMGKGDAAGDQVYALVDTSPAPAMTTGGDALAAADAGEAVSREALSDAAAAQSLAALSQTASDAVAWALDFAALPGGGGFDALGAMRGGLALSGGFEAFGGGGFSMGLAPGSSVSGGYGRGMIAATFTPEPVYPELARREGREGVVELAVTINASGRARTAEVVKSSGHADLDAAARSTVLAMWRFKRGEPGVKRDCVAQIAFSLRRR